MSRAKRFALRFLFAGALAGGIYLGWISTAGSPAPVDLRPRGAAVVTEVHDAERLAKRLSGTRFAAAFARSATRAWIERTAAVTAFDALLADVRRATGWSPGRGIAFDVAGSAAAAGWYPPRDGAGGATPWIAGGRLSLRGWAAATALRTLRALGLGSTLVSREVVAGRAVYTASGQAGRALHLFLVGRVLVAGSDRSLVLRAARGANGPDDSVTREPGWQSVRSVLPARGELFVWLRGQGLPLGVPAGGKSSEAGLGALLRAGGTVEIDVAAEAAKPRSDRAAVKSAQESLPAVSWLRRSPLFFFSSREPVPAAVAELLLARHREAVRRRTVPAQPVADIRPGSGYALVITDSSGGSGLFPAPRGLAVVGMGSAAEAARSLPLLYPAGARTAAGGTRALVTRESFPLAGEFELWGAAIGPRLVFATDAALLDTAAADAGSGVPGAPVVPEPPGWDVRAVAAISMDKTLPLLQRWSAPLSGLIAARWPEAPEITRDLGLLAATGKVLVVAGSDDRRDRAAITLNLRDLP
jgi:hypothetical protein